MQRFLFFLLIFAYQTTSAQHEETLYYYAIDDSLIGVKDKKGKIIIPAKHRLILDVNMGDTLPAGFVNFLEPADKPGQHAAWKTYDRKGNFLYQPYVFEFEPDRINEGLSRFVENDKIGFVDRHGKRIIPAQFESVDMFSLGIASFCNGCIRDTAKDLEHPPLVAGTFGFINRQGKVLMDDIVFDTSLFFWCRFDSLRHTFYPAEFQYNSFEKKLIQKLDPYKAAIEKMFFSKYTGNNSMSLIFDIVEKPSPGFPYYVIESREKIGNKISSDFWDRLQFYLNTTGEIMYAAEYFDGLVPFKEWYSHYTQKNFP